MNNQYPNRGGTRNETSGLQGLTQNIGKRQSAKDDLNTMGKLVQMKKQEEQEELQAAQMEQQQYDKINVMTTQMLKGDRTRLNKRAVSMQKKIKEQIRMFGGSRAAFMKNGGASLLNEYSSGLLTSEEFLTAKDNKVNLDRLVKMQMDGMGHLIPPEDVKNMTAYNLNGEGPITFSGVLSEINTKELAPLYDYGSDIPLDDILNNGDNRMKIYGNYQIIHPNEGVPTEARLLDFMKEQGYGGRGGNTTALQMRKTEENRRAKANADAEKNRKVSGVAASTRELLNDKKLTSVSWDNMGNNLFSSNPVFNSIAGGETNNKDIVSIDDNGNTNRPKGSSVIFRREATNYANTILADFIDKESGKITFNGEAIPLERFNSAGTKIDDKDNPKGEYSISGLMMGYGAKVGNASNPDSEQLVMEIINPETGEIDNDKTKELYGDNSKLVGKGGIYLALKSNNNEDENIYIKVDTESVQGMDAFVKDLGINDEDIQKSVKDQEYISNEIAVREHAKRHPKDGRKPQGYIPDIVNTKHLTPKQKDEEYALAELNYSKTAFSSAFKGDTFKANAIDAYTVRSANGVTSTRESLIKTFYQALAGGNNATIEKTVSQNNFKNGLQDSDLIKELEEMLLKPSVSDRDIMKFYNDESLKSTKPGNANAMTSVAALWNEYYIASQKRNK